MSKDCRDGLTPTYTRVMLKISGEALMGDQGFGLHPPTVERIAKEVKSVHELGVENWYIRLQVFVE